MEFDNQVVSLLAMAAVLFGSGLVAGFAGGLLGVGGGIVLVPVLFQVFTFLGVDESVRMQLAAGTSLATIIPTSIRSALAHHKKGAIDIALLRTWVPMVLVGVLSGILIARFASSDVLSGVFAVVALLVALNLGLSREGFHIASRLPRGPVGQIIPLFIGSLSSLMGIGGGTIGVPLLTLFNYPIRLAVATGAALGLIISVPGTVGFVIAGLGAGVDLPGTLGYVNVLGFAAIIPATMWMAPKGARMAHSIPPRVLRMVFGTFLLVTSLRMSYSLI